MKLKLKGGRWLMMWRVEIEAEKTLIEHFFTDRVQQVEDMLTELENEVAYPQYLYSEDGSFAAVLPSVEDQVIERIARRELLEKALVKAKDQRDNVQKALESLTSVQKVLIYKTIHKQDKKRHVAYTKALLSFYEKYLLLEDKRRESAQAKHKLSYLIDNGLGNSQKAKELEKMIV